jgi:hypothetical protein
MKGTLKKVNSQWLVYYQEEVMSRVTRALELPLYPGDVKTLNDYGDYSASWEDGLTVQFEIIDEFTHPQLYNGLEWGSGKMAKLL